MVWYVIKLDLDLVESIWLLYLWLVVVLVISQTDSLILLLNVNDRHPFVTFDAA